MWRFVPTTPPSFGGDHKAWSMELAAAEETSARAAQAGVRADAAKGWFVVDFAPPDRTRGGETGDLHGQPYEAAFVIAGSDILLRRVLPSLCVHVTGQACVDERRDQIFFANVTPGSVSVSTGSPPEETCELRNRVSYWPIFPGTRTVATVDCWLN